MLAEFFDEADVRDHFQAVRVNCSTDDTFGSLWSHVFAELDVPAPDDMSPGGIRRVLQALATGGLIVIDELDRLEDDDALTTLADTIKTLSDHAIDSTVVLVGVARSIGELIGEHASIVRALVQIEMPRMSLNELAEILWKGCRWAGLSVRPEAVEEMLLEGLPHYTCSVFTLG